MNKEYLKIARMLYKPSHKVEYMVLNMIKFFKNKNISNIHFPMGEVTFEQGIEQTVNWYLNNEQWWKMCLCKE